MTIDCHLPCVRINAPELIANKAFTKWLHNRSIGHAEESEAALGFETTGASSLKIATWHSPKNPTKACPPGEYSDIFTVIDHGEGSDSDMPAPVWKKIQDLVGPEFHGVVWMTFLKYP